MPWAVNLVSLRLMAAPHPNTTAASPASQVTWKLLFLFENNNSNPVGGTWRTGLGWGRGCGRPALSQLARSFFNWRCIWLAPLLSAVWHLGQLQPCPPVLGPAHHFFLGVVGTSHCYQMQWDGYCWLLEPPKPAPTPYCFSQAWWSAGKIYGLHLKLNSADRTLATHDPTASLPQHKVPLPCCSDCKSTSNYYKSLKIEGVV